MALDSGKVYAELILRCAHAAALRQVQHPRLPRAEPHAHACRRCSPIPRTSAPRAWRSALGVEHHKWFLKQDGPARPAAHRAAGKRRAAGAQALGRAEHRDHRVRPRPVGRAAAGGDGHRRADERRHADPADLPEAQPGRSREARQAGGQARDQREDALPDAAQRREGHRQQGRRRGLLCRRQDRHLGEGGRRPLFQDQAAQHLHRGAAGRQAALSAADHARRAAGDCRKPTAMPPPAGTRRRRRAR